MCRYSQNQPGDPQRLSLPSTPIQLKCLHLAAELNAESDHHKLHICLDHQVLHICLESWMRHICLDMNPCSLKTVHCLCQELLILNLIQTVEQSKRIRVLEVGFLQDPLQ